MQVCVPRGSSITSYIAVAMAQQILYSALNLEGDDTDEDIAEPVIKRKKTRTFQHQWKSQLFWLDYNTQTRSMLCSECSASKDDKTSQLIIYGNMKNLVNIRLLLSVLH